MDEIGSVFESGLSDAESAEEFIEFVGR